MNAVYRIANVLVALVFASTMGWAVYAYAPEFWHALDSVCVSAVAVVTLVGAIVIGFLAMDARTM